MRESLREFLTQGVVLGGLYALFAVGLTLIFGVLDVINVAHGEFFAVGGYLVFAAVVLLQLPAPAGGRRVGGAAALVRAVSPPRPPPPPPARAPARPPPPGRALSRADSRA